MNVSPLYDDLIALSLSLYFTVLVFFLSIIFIFYFILGILLSLCLLCCCIVLPSGVIKNNNRDVPSGTVVTIPVAHRIFDSVKSVSSELIV